MLVLKGNLQTMKASLALTDVWTNRLDTGRYFPFTLDYMNLFNSLLLPVMKKMKTFTIQSKIETQGNDNWHMATKISINCVCKLSKKNGKLLTGKKMLGSRAKIPVSFMQLPDALINGHLLRKQKKNDSSKQVTSSKYSQILFFIKEHSIEN